MKRYIKCNEDYSAMIIPDIIDEFGRDEPGTGPSFIADDGTYINIYPRIDVHEDLCEYIEDNFDIKLEYRDEEYFIREYGWIRLRIDPMSMIIEMPTENPTTLQWYSLSDWLECMYDEIRTQRSLYINILDTSKYLDTIFGTDVTPSDIMKALKRYYTSGELSLR